MNLITFNEDFLNLMISASDRKSKIYIQDYVESGLISLVKSADLDAKQLFFPKECSFDFDRITLSVNEELAARYLLYVISGCQQCPDLSRLIQEKSYCGVSSYLSFHAESIGEMIFLFYLKNHLELPQTMGEKDAAFTALANALVTTNFEAVAKAVSVSHSPAPAQLILAALKLLDSCAYNTVLLAWAQSEFFSREFADVDLMHLLENYPWLEAYHVDVLSRKLNDDIVWGIKAQPDKAEAWVKRSVLRYGLF